MVFLSFFTACETHHAKENPKNITVKVGGTPNANYVAKWTFGPSNGTYRGSVQLDPTIIISNLPPVDGTIEIKKIGLNSTLVIDVVENQITKAHLGIRAGEEGGRVTRMKKEWQSELF
ncbi:MAG: hypothetical protein JWN25_2812 [Verrucomicrobiales bacterium]|nr:hypothetical protein [Verrucomicrobiales bacterium]